MSMKAVELQFAVHKNVEAGIAQQQQQHRPVSDQALLAAQADRHTKQERHVSAKLEHKAESGIRERQTGQEGAPGQSGGRKRRDAETDAAHKQPAMMKDPFKGRHIDLSL